MTFSIVTPWRDCPELQEGYWPAVEYAQPDEIMIYTDKASKRIEWKVPLDLLPRVTFRDADGYVDACNQGLKLSTSDVVLWLNNDIVALASDWAMPVRNAAAPGRILGAALRSEPHSMVDGKWVAYLDGWCLAGWRTDMLKLGGLNEEFEEPAYFSDNDFCVRARAAGLKLIQLPIALRHLENYTSDKNPEQRTKASAHNQALYAKQVRELANA